MKNSLKVYPFIPFPLQTASLLVVNDHVFFGKYPFMKNSLKVYPFIPFPLQTASLSQSPACTSAKHAGATYTLEFALEKEAWHLSSFRMGLSSDSSNFPAGLAPQNLTPTTLPSVTF
jgi:hypothetical protein